jgi:hypothetical protein
MVRKYITLSIDYKSEYDDFVCKYIFKKGESTGDRCYVRNHMNGYCLKHFKLVQRYDFKKNIPRCQYETINGLCKRKCINENNCKYHKSNKKTNLYFSGLYENKKHQKLLCYHNDYKEKKKIDNIIIKDNILINNRSPPLLLCYNNDNLLFKEYIKKSKKRMKKLKYKKRRKGENKKINADIRIDFINEERDVFGMSILNKRRSPFPNGEIKIDNILYKNSYYEWKPIQKEVKLYCINIENGIKKIFIYSIDQFEKMLHDIYTKETVFRYFEW